MRLFYSNLVLLNLILEAPLLGATELDFSANAELQSRSFFHSPAWPNQDDQSIQTSISTTLEFRWQSKDRNQSITVIPYLRADETDKERNLADLQEAYWRSEFLDYQVLVGFNKVFWGVTESAHLVDIINQSDTLGDIDNEQKLGQPMIAFSAQKDWGELTAYLLTWFRERQFAGEKGRLRPPFLIDSDNARFNSKDENEHIDFALRYSQYVGDFDIGLSYFSGTNREPSFIPTESKWLPYYDQINQYSLDAQYTRDAWLWKLEGFYRESSTDNYWASVAGFEYTQYQVFNSAADLGYILEYQFDDRETTEPATIADNDIFIGARLALNDTQDASLLAGIIYDHKSDASLASIEAERRLGNSFQVKMRLRIFNAKTEAPSIYALNKDDYLQISLFKYF